MFHFNKKHLEDPSIPMWVLKTAGETLYVSHVNCQVPWTTKETPDNSHTKGSIKIKDCLLQIDEENSATVTKLTPMDEARIRNAKRGITRVITKWGNRLREVLKEQAIKHGPIKSIGGACSSTFYITDIYKKEQLPFLLLTLSDTDCRILQPNEGYYRMYDDPKYQKTSDIDLDAEDYWDDDDE